MLTTVFSFWISIIGRWTAWLFTLKINENPDITIGGFLLACAFIGLVLYFLIGAEHLPFHAPNVPHVSINNFTSVRNNTRKEK